MSTGPVLREDFGFVCRYDPAAVRLTWSRADLQVSCSASGGIEISGAASLYAIGSLVQLLALAERTHQQLKDSDGVAGGIWFGQEFWPWSWIREGYPGRRTAC